MERLQMNDVRELIYRLRSGEGVRRITRALGFSRNTVRKWRDLAAKQGLLEPAQSLPDAPTLAQLLGPPPRPSQMQSTVEPYSEVVAGLLDAGVEQMAIWQRLRQEHGYTGSYSSVRRFVGHLRPRQPEAFCRVETAPGEEAQVDFGFAGCQWDGRTGRRRKTWAFVMTLSWSRHQYVEFVFDQKIETWLECHEHALSWFNGVPRRIVLDNLKAGVIKFDLHDPVLSEPYRRLAQHYGFVISPNRPATPRHKGKVEQGVHYVKRNFLAGQEFADLEAMNQRVKQWALEVAGLRVHGTTREAPLGRFERTEREALQALPATSFELLAVHQAKVQHDCHVVVGGRYYSVPCALVGQSVEVYVGRRLVEIYQGMQLVTTHPVVAEPGGRSTRNEHYPEGKRQWLENPPERCQERAQAVGVSCGEVVERLLTDRVQDHLRSVQALLRLGQTVGSQRLEGACRRALHYGDPSYRRIKAILDAGLESKPTETPSASAATVGNYQYARPAACFFEREVAAC